MSLYEHPGFMSYPNGLIEVLHADWTAYPKGHGWKLALQSLAVFPNSTKFKSIDEIDKCFLFIATGADSCMRPNSDDDLFDEKWFHLAIWEEDLIELHKKDYISGVNLISQYEKELKKHQEIKALGEIGVTINNVFVPVKLPKPEPENYEEFLPCAVNLNDSTISISDLGLIAAKYLAPKLDDMHKDILGRIYPVMQLKFYDTVIREATIILEVKIKSLLNTTKFGQALITEYYNFLCSRQGNRTTPFLKNIRCDLRAIFKFVRNDYAHNLKQINEAQCLLLLNQISDALSNIDEIERIENE